MSAHRDAFDLVAETCPAVDGAARDFEAVIGRAISDHMDDLVAVVKKQTETLRAALIEVIEERNTEKQRADDLQSQMEQLKGQLSDANEKIEALETAT